MRDNPTPQASDKVYVTPEALLQSLKDQGRGIDYLVPPHIILYYGAPQVPKVQGVEWGEVKSFLLGKMTFVKNRNVAVLAQMGVGAPAMALHVELLIALGVKKIIAVGSAGSLSPAVTATMKVINDKAFRGEGVSAHYAAKNEFTEAHPQLVQDLENTFKKRGMQWLKGAVWTTDAIFRETIDEVRKFREKGAVTVDMEASALYAVTSFRQVQSASLFAISDHLHEGEWQPAFHKLKEPLSELLSVAIETLDR